MKLQGRNLSIHMHGDDVALLHLELQHLGLPIPDDELWAALFGPRTLRAVMDFQNEDNGGQVLTFASHIRRLKARVLRGYSALAVL